MALKPANILYNISYQNQEFGTFDKRQISSVNVCTDIKDPLSSSGAGIPSTKKKTFTLLSGNDFHVGATSNHAQFSSSSILIMSSLSPKCGASRSQALHRIIARANFVSIRREPLNEQRECNSPLGFMGPLTHFDFLHYLSLL